MCRPSARDLFLPVTISRLARPAFLLVEPRPFYDSMTRCTTTAQLSLEYEVSL